MKCQLCKRNNAVLKASFYGAILDVCVNCVLVFDNLIPLIPIEVLNVQKKQKDEEDKDRLETGSPRTFQPPLPFVWDTGNEGESSPSSPHKE